MSSPLTLEKLVKRYGDNPPAVDSLDLAVEAGEFVALLGPSGCGKTTTLRMIAGLVPVTGGVIRVGGRDITRLAAYDRGMGLVFQNYALFPHMSVAQNVGFGLEMRGVAAADREKRVRDALATVRLEALGHRRPRELSGGQQQRVALARALVIEPSILLLDEPLSNLDAKLREEMRGEIRDIQRRFGMTAIFVTHDQVEALAMCDRIAVMNGGRIEQIGTPRDIHEHPATPFVAGFVGRINRFHAALEDGAPRLGPYRLSADSGSPRTGNVEVMIRPHRIDIRPAGAAAPDGVDRVEGRVTRVTYLGEITQYEVEVAGVSLSVERTSERGAPPHAPGDAVGLSWLPADKLVFPVAA